MTEFSSGNDFAARLAAVRQRIREAAERAGRASTEVELIAVSKTHPPEAVREAVECGHLVFGESRVQEARAKIPLCPGRARWHLIGHLQKNKIRHALPLFELIHSVDSLALAQDIARVAAEDGQRPAVLLEVNVAGEATKFGFAADKLEHEMEALLALDRLRIEGLMCIPPLKPRAEDARPFFVKLREVRDALSARFGCALPQLSMGMSGDFEVAIEEGATCVRIGTAIFGPRSGKAFRAE